MKILIIEDEKMLADSVLWYVGEALLYAGSVFGIKSYIDYKLRIEN